MNYFVEELETTIAFQLWNTTFTTWNTKPENPTTTFYVSNLVSTAVFRSLKHHINYTVININIQLTSWNPHRLALPEISIPEDPDNPGTSWKSLTSVSTIKQVSWGSWQSGILLSVLYLLVSIWTSVWRIQTVLDPTQSPLSQWANKQMSGESWWSSILVRDHYLSEHMNMCQENPDCLGSSYESLAVGSIWKMSGKSWQSGILTRVPISVSIRTSVRKSWQSGILLWVTCRREHMKKCPENPDSPGSSQESFYLWA